MQKLIVTLVLVFVLFVTATIGHPGYGNYGESSHFPNLSNAKAHIETMLSFTEYSDPSISEPLLKELIKEIAPASMGVSIDTEATGSERLNGRQRIELKFSTTTTEEWPLWLWDGYDPRKMKIMKSSPTGRVYFFCVRIIGGNVAVEPDPNPNGKSSMRKADCLALEIDKSYLLLADIYDWKVASIQYAIFSHKRIE